MQPTARRGDSAWTRAGGYVQGPTTRSRASDEEDHPSHRRPLLVSVSLNLGRWTASNTQTLLLPRQLLPFCQSWTALTTGAGHCPACLGVSV